MKKKAHAYAAALMCSLAIAPAIDAAQQSTTDGTRAATEEPQQERFEVAEIRVLGNTVLDDLSIERAVYPHLGALRTIKDIEAARVALETAYRDHGFGTVFV